MLMDNQFKKSLQDREYKSPQCKVIGVHSQSIICTSDGPTEKVNEYEGEW